MRAKLTMVLLTGSRLVLVPFVAFFHGQSFAPQNFRSESGMRDWFLNVESRMRDDVTELAILAVKEILQVLMMH